MKKLLLLLLALPAFPQAIQYSTTLIINNPPPGNNDPNFISQSTVTVNTTTFTDATASVPCPSNAQIVLPGSATCVARPSTSDVISFWLIPGSYTFIVKLPAGQLLGPFPFTTAGTGPIPEFPASIFVKTVLTLPPAQPSNQNYVYLVVDGTTSSDCTVGGGTIQVWCGSNGTAYNPVGGGGGGGGGGVNFGPAFSVPNYAVTGSIVSPMTNVFSNNTLFSIGNGQSIATVNPVISLANIFDPSTSQVPASGYSVSSWFNRGNVAINTLEQANPRSVTLLITNNCGSLGVSGSCVGGHSWAVGGRSGSIGHYASGGIAAAGLSGFGMNAVGNDTNVDHGASGGTSFAAGLVVGIEADMHTENPGTAAGYSVYATSMDGTYQSSTTWGYGCDLLIGRGSTHGTYPFAGCLLAKDGSINSYGAYLGAQQAATVAGGSTVSTTNDVTGSVVTSTSGTNFDNFTVGSDLYIVGSSAGTCTANNGQITSWISHTQVKIGCNASALTNTQWGGVGSSGILAQHAFGPTAISLLYTQQLLNTSIESYNVPSSYQWQIAGVNVSTLTNTGTVVYQVGSAGIPGRLNVTNGAGQSLNISLNTLAATINAPSGGTIVSTVNNVTVQTDLIDTFGNASVQLGSRGGAPLPGTSTLIAVGPTAGGNGRIVDYAFGGSANFNGVSTGGTQPSPTAVQFGALIVSYEGYAYNGTSTLNGPDGGLLCYANENQTASNGGTFCAIATTPNGTTTQQSVMIFENNGGIITPGVTGGNMGPGTLNVNGAYVNGVPVGGTGSTWPSLAGGTNNSSAFVCDTGCSINPTNSGVVAANNAGAGLSYTGGNLVVNTSVVSSIAANQSGVQNGCVSTNGTPSYTCTFAGSGSAVLPTLTLGMKFTLVVDTASTTTASITIDTTGTKTLTLADCLSSVGTAIAAGQMYWVWYNGSNFCLTH